MTPSILKNLDMFSPGAFYSTPLTIRYERVLKVWIIAHKWQLHTQKYKTTKKQISEASAKWKEVEGKLGKINELILKTKSDLKEGPNNIIIFIFGLCFLLVDWLSFGEGGSFEIGGPRLRGWKNVGLRWTRGVGGPENWTIFMDVMCVSSFIWFWQFFLFLEFHCITAVVDLN